MGHHPNAPVSSIGSSDQLRNWTSVKPLAPAKAEEFDNRPDRDWLNPISMSKLQAAVAKKAKQIELNGHLFNIEYGLKMKMPVSNELRDIVRLTRADGELAPCGDISIKRLQQFTFEED